LFSAEFCFFEIGGPFGIGIGSLRFGGLGQASGLRAVWPCVALEVVKRRCGADRLERVAMLKGGTASDR